MTYEIPDAPTANEIVERLPKKVIAMRVWLSLDEAERKQLRDATDLFENLPESERHRLHQIVINVKTGPWGPSCPYCGRS